MESKFQTRLQALVLEELERKSLNIAELSDILRTNYHSTRNAVRSLQHKGLVKSVDSITQRNTKYELGHQTGGRLNTIPSYRGEKISKAMAMFQTPMESSNGCKAVMALPKHITRIMKSAVDIANGIPSELSIQLTQEQMDKDLNTLKAIVGIYEHILSDPQNWSPEFLSRYPNDPEWDNDLFEAALAHYYPKD